MSAQHRAQSPEHTPGLGSPSEAKPERPSLEEVLRRLRAALPELQQRYGVRALGVFGSYVRAEEKRRSDLDVLVEFDDAPSLFKFVELQNYLGEIIGIKVDLVMKKALKPEIGRYILEEVVPV